MISTKVTETKKLQTETGNHITHCSFQIVNRMTDIEITEFSAEVNIRRFQSTAFRAVNGTHNRTGEQLTEKEIASEKVSIVRMISDHIDAVIRQG